MYIHIYIYTCTFFLHPPGYALHTTGISTSGPYGDPRQGADPLGCQQCQAVADLVASTVLVPVQARKTSASLQFNATDRHLDR